MPALARKFQRYLKRKSMALIKKLRKANHDSPPEEKSGPMIIVPEMIGSMIGV